jgi:uncharacterized protein with HEPN domain
VASTSPAGLCRWGWSHMTARAPRPVRNDCFSFTERTVVSSVPVQLVDGVTVEELEADRQRRDALLWNFTVLGEAAGQLSGEVKARFPEIAWQQPVRLRNRIIHGYWSIDLEVLHTTADRQLSDFTENLRRTLTTLQGAD